MKKLFVFLCIMALFLTGCGSADKKQDLSNSSTVNTQLAQQKGEIKNEELGKIKARITVDWAAKKDNMTKSMSST